MKGYLDAKELESYKKEDLQELAKQLGVDAEGTKKEIAARCAAVEVDIPDNSELTEEDKKVAAEAAAEAAAKAEEEKAAAEAAAKVEEEKAAAEAAAKVEEEKAAAEVAAKAEEEKAAAEAAAKDEEEKKAAGLVKVKAQRRFLDKELNQIKDTGDVYTVSRERAAVLKEAGVAEVAE
ncbi:hypothetical protein DWZ45_08470 [Clostridium sp. AF32-7AC]|jgi:hypothetical protein|uniref:hypothetical protein n=1 Tax=Clostridium sp. AF32-7AC TaxID=2293010 RepID=UPI000E4AD856|nr:hypothetical protein [Clostridium sp. AF32-7AC]RGH44536.1 hypothetical protein DW898_05040 [Ruminococcus sp. AM41-2AC]RHP41426.1 hypothetical protein DWZ45_08470 [Clostridium sp. AF32-7AC]UWG92683.1 MAG: hypothetical protein [Bacteriophage sp.]